MTAKCDHMYRCSARPRCCRPREEGTCCPTLLIMPTMFVHKELSRFAVTRSRGKTLYFQYIKSFLSELIHSASDILFNTFFHSPRNVVLWHCIRDLVIVIRLQAEVLTGGVGAAPLTCGSDLEAANLRGACLTHTHT